MLGEPLCISYITTYTVKSLLSLYQLYNQSLRVNCYLQLYQHRDIIIHLYLYNLHCYLWYIYITTVRISRVSELSTRTV